MSYHVNPIARSLPRLGARSVGGLGTVAPPPVLHAAPRPLTAADWANIAAYAKAVKAAEAAKVTAPPPPTTVPVVSLATLVSKLQAKGATPDEVGYFQACMTDKLGDKPPTACETEARSLAKLSAEGLAFYKSCASQRAADMPVRTQHSACYGEALKIASGGAAPDGGGATTTAGMGTTKWLLIGGVAVALYFLVIRR